MKNVAIVGGGWYGSHIALHLAEKGYEVDLYEKNSKLFSQISGQFGIRLHIGPHYPRSQETRRHCALSFDQFKQKYPELIVDHETSIYAIGEADASGAQSKVTADDFVEVCKENSICEVTRDIGKIKEKGYDNLKVFVELEEPSICVGRDLDSFFVKKLTKYNVTIHYSSEVKSVQKGNNGKFKIIDGSEKCKSVDHVINTSSFQSMLPSKNLKLPFSVFYQPCLALEYKDKRPSPSGKPFSFIVMDGWYPCIMPVVEYDAGAKKQKLKNQYILTHGSYTIMGSYVDVKEAIKKLKGVDHEFIHENVKPKCEKETLRFYPGFLERFEFVGWRGAVQAKIKSETEHRGSVVFSETESGQVYVLPGKVSHVLAAARDVDKLIGGDKGNVVTKDGLSFVDGGTLQQAEPEFSQPVVTPNTCTLQTYACPEEQINSDQAQKICVTHLVPITVMLLVINELTASSPLSRTMLGLSAVGTAIAQKCPVISSGFSLFGRLSGRLMGTCRRQKGEVALGGQSV